MRYQKIFKKFQVGYCQIIRLEREKAGISLQALAEKMEMSLLSIQAIEQGIQSPKCSEYYSIIHCIGPSAVAHATEYHLEASLKLCRLKIPRQLDQANDILKQSASYAPSIKRPEQCPKQFKP